MPVLVTGGTGTLGRAVVARFRAAGTDVRVLSRHRQPPQPGVEFVVGDLATGSGIDPAVAGVSTIVHCAGSYKGDADATTNLVRAARQTTHLVFISVVGADRIPMVGAVDRRMFGYYANKLAAERVVERSGLPWTTLRATQFHELILTVARAVTKLPVVPLPSGFRFQPVLADDVAARLIELAQGEPAGLVADFGGPRVYRTEELVRGYLRAIGKRRPILPIRLPGQAARALRAGVNLCPDQAAGRGTWEAFLSERVGR
jgi:uncharacterized protein YbjT (DUF2867 family)